MGFMGFMGFYGLDVGDAHDVGKDTSSGDACTCTIALDEHGIFLIALSGEEYDVVRALETVERMSVGYLLQGHAGLER